MLWIETGGNLVMKSKKFYGALSILVMLFVFVMVVASCFDDDNGNGSSTDPSTTPTTLPPGAMIYESLRDGQTVGVVKDGVFTPEGLQLQGGWGYISYSIPTTASGYVEFTAKGLVQDESPYGGEFKAMLLTMWSGDGGYDYDNSPFIFELRKFGHIPGRPDAANCLNFRIKSNYQWAHGHFHVVSWNPNIAYQFRLEWRGGQALLYRNGELVVSETYIGEFAPSNHKVQIGANMENVLSFRWKESSHNLLISDVTIGTL